MQSVKKAMASDRETIREQAGFMDRAREYQGVGLKILCGALAFALLAWVWNISPRAAANGRIPAPALVLPMQVNGPPMPLSAFKGRVVILDFWATWCGPCRASIPALEAVYKKYRSQGLEVVGISRDHSETRGQIPAMAKTLGITYPLVVADDVPDINDNYGTDSLPTMIMIDRQGNVADAKSGLHSPEELEAKVRGLLAEAP